MIKAKTSPIEQKPNITPMKTITKQVKIATNGANNDKTFTSDSLPMDKSIANDLLPEQLLESTQTSPPISSLALGGFNTLKTDLPGRVSFSKNDVYEIDYSDIDNDTDTSRSYDLIESFRKKNVHFEDEYTADSSRYGGERIGSRLSDLDNRTKLAQLHSDSVNDAGSSKRQQSTDDNKLLPSMESTSNNMRNKLELSTRLDVLPEVNENGANGTSENENENENDTSAKIIEDYKREIENMNRQHEMQLKWNEAGALRMDYLPKGADSKPTNMVANVANFDELNEYSGSGDSWFSPNNDQDKKSTEANVTSDESAIRDSTSTVINNYLKITNQKSDGSSKPSSATIKLRTTKKLTTNGGGGGGRIKSGQSANQTTKANSSTARMTKAKSATQLHRIADIKLDEFQIDKVESWMSTHKDTFSDAGLNSYRKQGKFGSTSNLDYKKTWRETPMSKTDDEGNYSLDDQVDNTSIDGSTSGEIELVLKKLEGRRMKISFGEHLSATINWRFF